MNKLVTLLILIGLAVIVTGCTTNSISKPTAAIPTPNNVFTIATNTYTNPNNRFSINYPSKFKYEENLWKGSTSFSVSFFENPDNVNFGLPIGISIFEGKVKRAGTDFGGYNRTIESITQLKDKQPTKLVKIGEGYYKKISDVTLSSYTGVRFYELNSFNPTKIDAENVAIVKGDTTYLISSTLDMTVIENKTLFNEMLQSLKVN